jgi:hypothetical protein
MRKLRKALALAVIAIFAASGSALAVGYERYTVNGTPKRVTPAKGKRCTTLNGALAEATFLKKYPGWIDGAAFFVKDILSQFGIVNKKAP